MRHILAVAVAMACLVRVDAAVEKNALEADWGIQISSLHMSAGGHIIDFRYKVTDPKKAASLGAAGENAYLIDEASGTKMPVPNMPTLGRLRQTTEQMTPGRIYFVLFANAGRMVKPGGKVTVVIGNFRAENLVVE
jgi:hypothetical protein